MNSTRHLLFKYEINIHTVYMYKHCIKQSRLSLTRIVRFENQYKLIKYIRFAYDNNYGPILLSHCLLFFWPFHPWLTVSPPSLLPLSVPLPTYPITALLCSPIIRATSSATECVWHLSLRMHILLTTNTLNDVFGTHVQYT